MWDKDTKERDVRLFPKVQMRTVKQVLATVGEWNTLFHMKQTNKKKFTVHYDKGNILHIKIGIAEITLEHLHFRIVEKHWVTLFYGRVLQSVGCVPVIRSQKKGELLELRTAVLLLIKEVFVHCVPILLLL